jgi:hypothetical protein
MLSHSLFPDIFSSFLEFFYRSHDPTTLNRQGADSGTRMSLSIVPVASFDLFLSFCAPHHLPSITEYRSAIFTHSPEQMEIAERVTKEVQAKRFTPKVCVIFLHFVIRSFSLPIHVPPVPHSFFSLTPLPYPALTHIPRTAPSRRS